MSSSMSSMSSMARVKVRIVSVNVEGETGDDGVDGGVLVNDGVPDFDFDITVISCDGIPTSC